MRPATATLITSSLALIAWGCDKLPSRPNSSLRAPTAELSWQSACDAPRIPKYSQLDFATGWSRDGQQVAFRRAFQSPIGPPGLYVERRTGGHTTFVTAGDLFWPKDVSFDPSGSRISWVSDFRLYVGDLRSRSVSGPLGGTNGVTFADWSPIDDRLVIARANILRDLPEDSIGFHILDLQSGVDTPLRANGRPLVGSWPRWAPDGRSIAMAEYNEGARISLLSLATGQLRVIWQGGAGDRFVNLHWTQISPYVQPRLVFEKVAGDSQGSYEFIPGTGQVLRLNIQLSLYDRFSPARREVLLHELDERDSIGVLFLRPVDGPRKASDRQITFWCSRNEAR